MRPYYDSAQLQYFNIQTEKSQQVMKQSNEYRNKNYMYMYIFTLNIKYQQMRNDF